MTSDTEDAAALAAARQSMRCLLEATRHYERDGDGLRLLHAHIRAERLAPAKAWLDDDAHLPALRALWDEERRRVGLPAEFAELDAKAELPTPRADEAMPDPPPGAAPPAPGRRR